MICTIFGGADIRDYERYADIISASDIIIAADRGFMHCQRLGIADRVKYLVGDFDSYEGDIPDDINVIKSPAEKDDTDLMLAVKLAIDEGAKSINLCGVVGGRLGHTMASIQTLSYIHDKGIPAFIIGDDCDIEILGKGTHSFGNPDGKIRYISVFSLSEKSNIIERGMKYSGELHLTDTFPLGVSNEFSGDFCEIEVKSGKIAVFLEKM